MRLDKALWKAGEGGDGIREEQARLLYVDVFATGIKMESSESFCKSQSRG